MKDIEKNYYVYYKNKILLRSYFFYFFFLEFLLRDNLDQDFGEWQKDLCKDSVNSMLNMIEFEFSEYEG